MTTTGSNAQVVPLHANSQNIPENKKQQRPSPNEKIGLLLGGGLQIETQPFGRSGSNIAANNSNSH